MKSKTTWLWLGLALAIGIYLLGPWNSEERQLRRQLATIEELVVKEGTESDLDAANKARKLGDLFTRGFEIRLLPFDQVVTDRQRMMQVMLATAGGANGSRSVFATSRSLSSPGARPPWGWWRWSPAGRAPSLRARPTGSSSCGCAKMVNGGSVRPS